MNPLLKRLGLVFAVVCGVGLIVIAAIYARPAVMYARKLLIQARQLASRRPTIPPHEVPGQRTRIDALVASLKRETWDQSVENVLTNSQFTTGVWPATSGDQVTLEQMLSARRAVKLLNTLEALPMNKRVEKCRELFDRVMRVYGQVYEDLAVSGSAQWEPPIQQRGRLHPTHALCLAMFATAETGRRDILAEQFLRLEDLRQRVERRMDDNKAAYSEWLLKTEDDFELWKRFTLTHFCALEERFLVNVLRVAVLRDPKAPKNLLDQIDTYCRSADMKAREVLIVPWNARTTSFERLVGSGADTSKGVTKYVFFDFSSEARMEEVLGRNDLKREIVQKVRELALKP